MSLAVIMSALMLFVQPAAGAPPAATNPTIAPPEELPSLDEALGLKPQTPKGETSKNPALVDLDKALGHEEEGDLLAQAADLMDRSAKRLADDKDAGLDTQRLQEDAIRKLDALIAQAQNNQQQKQQKKKKQKEDQQQQSEQQKQQQQSQQAQGKPQNSPASADHAGPAAQEAQLKAAQAAAGATWGNLPPHLRDALRQGRSDQFSSLYQQLTEQYYKRLAEEPKK